MRTDYDGIPEIAQMCRTCRYKDCIGQCDDIKVAYEYLDEGIVATADEIRAEVNRRYNQGGRWPGARTKYTINGETHTVSEWCKRHNRDVNTVWQRVKKQGMTFEEALTATDRRINRLGKVITENGETLKEIAQRNGIAYSTLWGRLNVIGMSLDEAVALGPAKPRGKRGSYGNSKNPE